MDDTVLKVYLIFNLFLFIFGLYIFFKTTPDLAKKHEYGIFKTFVGAYGVYLIPASSTAN